MGGKRDLVSKPFTVRKGRLGVVEQRRPLGKRKRTMNAYEVRWCKQGEEPKELQGRAWQTQLKHANDPPKYHPLPDDEKLQSDNDEDENEEEQEEEEDEEEEEDFEAEDDDEYAGKGRGADEHAQPLNRACHGNFVAATEQP